MIKAKTFLIAATLSASLLQAQTKKLFNETPEQKEKRMAWWTHDRFGMFIHWGLYALPARHEWVKQNERLTNEQYQNISTISTPICTTLKSGQRWQKQQA